LLGASQVEVAPWAGGGSVGWAGRVFFGGLAAGGALVELWLL